MILAVAMLATAAGLLLFLGAAQSHWIAPAALFAVSAPAVMVLSLDLPIERTAAYQGALLAGYYVVFAVGRWTAPRVSRR
jgi:hypothetical protein